MADEDVFCFDVTVEDSLVVEVLAALGDLVDDGERLVLGHAALLLQERLEVALRAELEEKVNIIGSF